MEKYFKRKIEDEANFNDDSYNISKKSYVEINLDDIPADPGLRKKISDYHPNDRDRVRRAYLLKGPYQPRDHIFPQTQIGNRLRRFNPDWFDEFKSWLEYSVTKDAVFCLFCYLYRPDTGDQGSSDSFDTRGFKNWKKKDRFQVHVGNINSAHNIALKKCTDLMNQAQHISFACTRPSAQSCKDYRTRLTASVDCARFLLQQGLAFRGHNEFEESDNQGNFLELLHFLSNHNDEIKKVIENAPGNNKLISPDIQKDITHAVAVEISNVIINELGNDFFAILLDETRDVSVKEQVAIAIRFVDKKGYVVERFIGIIHVNDTSAPTLKRAIKAIFARYGLSIAQLRGQGYDGASNMRGEFNGLKTLIMNDNYSAYYIYCFAHQLQLALITVAKNHVQIASLFNIISNLVNVVGCLCKRRDILRENQHNKLIEQLRIGDIPTGRGLNQEIGLKRAGETRWGSHYGSILNLILMFDSIIDTLEIIIQDGSSSEQRGEAYALLESTQCFEFIFSLHLMKSILGITNELSQILQKKDQDIINSMHLVKVSKLRLQNMRDAGWNTLLEEVQLFCIKNNIIVPEMTEMFIIRGRSRRYVQRITNLHHYQVELFYTVIDMQLQEMNNRFNEINTELLLCVACLNPCDSFLAFDKERLVRLAQFYPTEFSNIDLMVLDSQLQNFIIDMRTTETFWGLKGIGELAQKLVETKKNDIYPLVYLLVKLSLILPIATATVERAFSAMKIIKNRLRSRMGDSWMNDCLITYIEKDIFHNIDNEVIIQRFQNMKTRREKL